MIFSDFLVLDTNPLERNPGAPGLAAQVGPGAPGLFLPSFTRTEPHRTILEGHEALPSP